MSYFTNLVLIATFLGLGLGCAISNRNPNLVFLPASFSVLVFLAAILKEKGVSGWSGIADFIFLTHMSNPVPMSIAVPLMFVLIFSVFVFIGTILGKCFGYFKPLISYSINVFASIVGIAVFTLLSFKFTPPHLWFLIGFIALLWFFKKQLLPAIVILSLSLFFIYKLGVGQIWSPYYKIEIFGPSQAKFFQLTVNNDYQQEALNFSTELSEGGHWKDIYNLPYLFTKPERVLILGSGVGNDVLLAVKNSVSKINAVEIDPVIVDIGKRMRPDNPYGDPKVTTFVDDARSYLNRHKEQYDLIVYGFLDSHALFANMAGVRLDNFVYTVEGIKQAKSLLSKEGTMALSFYVGRPWIGNKIYYMLKEAFGHSPLVYQSNFIPTEQVFIISVDKQKIAKKDISGFSEISTTYELSKRLPVPTDDWPYFYLEGKSIPSQYLFILFIIFVLSAGIIVYFLPKNKNTLNYSAFFFLGAAFMLIEAKSIVQLSLLFGTTWLVNSAVISSILIMILTANMYTIKFKPKRIAPFYLLLFLSLLVNSFLGPKDITLSNQFLKTLFSVFLVTSPLFFAAAIFAFLFKKIDIKDTSVAFGINLLGVVLGGFLEYASLILGLTNLVFIALFIYCLSYLGYRRVIPLGLR
jgi:spermidine synthase